MRDLLLVGVGRMGRPYIAAARRLGVHVRGIEFGARAVAVEGLLDNVHVARGGLDELLAEAAYAVAMDKAPDAVVAFSEEHVMGAALLQDALGLPGPSLHASVLSRNKALQRARFSAEGLSQPDYLVTEHLHDAEDWAAAHLPVIIKPLSSTGSSGVELVPDLAGYRAAADRRSHEGRLLVEEAVQGPEFSWEGLVRDGEVWFSNVTEKDTTGPPHFVEVVHRAAADLNETVTAQVGSLGHGVIAALGFRTGLVHLEFRIAETGPTIMEVAVRTPGDYIMDILGLTYGFDWFEMTLRLALGLPLPAPPSGPCRYAASFLLVVRPGRVTSVTGLAEVLSHPGVVAAEVKVVPGDVIAPVQSSTGRVGSVIISAETRSEQEAGLDFVGRTLQVHTT